MLRDVKRDLSLKIHSLGGIKFKEEGYLFNLHKKYPEAPRSPNYVDLRGIVRDRCMRMRIAGLMAGFILEVKPDRLIDLPEAITPLVTTLSDMTGIEMISVRSEALKGTTKDHGEKNIINGHFERGMTGLLIDDVVSSMAFTKFNAFPILRNAGLNLLPYVCVIIDREEGGAERLSREGYELKSLLGLHADVTRDCFGEGIISEEIIRMSADFAKAAKEYSLQAE